MTVARCSMELAGNDPKTLKLIAQVEWLEGSAH